MVVTQEVVYSFAAAIILVPTLAHYWSKLRVKEWEMSLKHAMIERGMSALDIERVIKATSRGGLATEAIEEAGDGLELAVSATSCENRAS